MTAHVNDSCIGCGLCANLCPTVFTMTDAGVASARYQIPADAEGQTAEAAQSCPVSAIEIT